MRILSISIGKVKPLFGISHPDYKMVQSGIDKKSISNLEKPRTVRINTLGVEGDEQADLTVHGGLEKAIYAYPSEHYQFWNNLLSQETNQLVNLQHGALGENFTIEGLKEADVFVGDIWRIGDVELSVVKLREPCYKFNAKFGYKGSAKTMLQSGFCGWYLRVNRSGSLCAGEEIYIEPGSQTTSIASQNIALLKRNIQTD